MKENDRLLCTENSRHIDIKYFFTKDRVGKKEVRIQYCKTDDTLANFFMKPLQCSLFKKMRSLIMGHSPINPPLPSTEEHVGDTVIASVRAASKYSVKIYAEVTKGI